MASSATEKYSYTRCPKCGRPATVTVPAGMVIGMVTCQCGETIEAPKRRIRVPDVVLPRM